MKQTKKSEYQYSERSSMSLLRFDLLAALLFSSLIRTTGFSIPSGRAFLLRPGRDRHETFCQFDPAIRCWQFQRTLHTSPTRFHDSTSPDMVYLEHSAATDSIGHQPPTSMNGHRNGAIDDNESMHTNGITHAAEPLPTTPDNSKTKDDHPRPTENGGFTHTSASRAKISAGNKGNTPWNKGKTRSEEVRAKIAAGVRARNRERFLEKLQNLGITEEEHALQKKAERREKDAERRARRTEKGGYRPTDETRQKISEVLKEKYAKGEIKRTATDPSKVRRGFTHSEETRQKISESLKARWAQDPGYRKKMVTKSVTKNSSEDTRKKISETLKKKWLDPEFRATMLAKMATRKTATGKPSPEHRAKIAASMKARWQDPDYRQKTINGIQKRRDEQIRLGILKPKEPKPRKKKVKKKKKKNLKPVMESVIPRAPREVGALKPSDQASNKNKRKVKRKKTQNLTPTKLAEPKLIPVAKKATPKRKKAASKKKPKEPDGSVNRLREERRDLFDLLYGDEEDGEQAAKQSAVNPKFAPFGDEDLDEFDPYGLEDY